MCPFGSMPEMSASMNSRVSRLRNTLGRMSVRRFADHATSSPAGSAPCVSTWPIFDGIGMISGSVFHVPL